jgi:ribosome-binding factor A
MKKNVNRPGRIADQIQRDIMDILRNKVKDPRVKWVTVNDVIVAHDYSVAKIYWTIFDDSKRDDAEIGLEASRGFIRSLLSKGFTTYSIPQLKFIYDESLARGSKILDLINKTIASDEEKQDEEKQD